MEYLLFFILVILFLVNYYFSGKDFFTPGTMLTVCFLFAHSLCIYRLAQIGYSLHAVTSFTISLCMMISTVISITTHQCMRGIKIVKSKDNLSPISSRAFLMVLLITVLTIIWQMGETIRVGADSDFFQRMINYHLRESYTTDWQYKRPLLLKQLENGLASVIILYFLNWVKFGKNLLKREKIISAITILLCALCCLLLGGRLQLVSSAIGCAIVYHILRIRKYGKYRTYKFSTLLRIIAIGAAALYLFYVLKNFVGRQSESDVFDYIAHYIGDCIINLDLYFRNPPMPSKIWGRETFAGILNNLQQLGLLKVDRLLSHLEFRRMNGVELGNVYTAFRSYHHDFGWPGVVILHSVFSLFYSLSYEYIKKKQSQLGAVIYGMMYFPLVLSFFTQMFFSSVLTAGFFIRTMTTLFLFWMLFCRHPKAVHRKYRRIHV